MASFFLLPPLQPPVVQETVRSQRLGSCLVHGFKHILIFKFVFYDLAFSKVPGVKEVLPKFVDENC